TGLIYRVKLKNLKYEVTERGIYISCIKYGTQEYRVCIYSITQGFDKFNLKSCGVFSGITNKKGNDYREIGFTDNAFYGFIKIKVHILIAALNSEVRYKIIFAMGTGAKYVVHHKNGKHNNLSIYLEYMSVVEHVKVTKIARDLAKKHSRVARVLG
ncbi:MAG TPA: hypothetical protein VIK26_11090, partial [Clostridium sp.]